MKKHPLKLYNTLGRKKQLFKPIKKGMVGLYTCGPTVYSYAHIGNLRTYIFEDILKRVLIENGYKVKHVMNITDVGHLTSDADTGEDKVEKSAKEQKKTVWDIAGFYTKVFQEDIAKLHILDPDIWCRATDHIKEQIELIKKLEKKGLTYKTSDGIYFDTSKFKDYGILGNIKAEGLKAGVRVEIGEKKNPTDFALWKFSPKDSKRQMEWKSPWSEKGFPGWHIECSAMSMKYLGNRFDIHCGGEDHIHVHHPNEIAQSEGVIGKKWVNFWMHGIFLVLDKDKMSKSKGNILTLSSLEEEGYGPLIYRYLCLNTHYRKPLSFSFEAMDTAKNSFERFKEKILEIRGSDEKKGEGRTKKYREDFYKSINDDLNMPKALSIAWNLLRDEKLGDKWKWELIQDFDHVLGFDVSQFEKEEVKISDEVKKLVDKREKLRKAKKFDEADKIRDELRKEGYELMDTPSGVEIKKV